MNQEARQLLADAEPYTHYGPDYNRNIDAAAADLRKALDHNHPPKLLGEAIRVLKLRLNLWVVADDAASQIE